ncbi:cleft lip and palate transmembrane protein 1-domain-containing protein [Aspergillus bertholletiae]|uniref:Cleft lip and palate transmembrane protein 1-domain-containing protein n=1 Tax=Aspergillus bertholletiae TaxID=1226010 RepID=A0A5N7ASK3_9EURO|nr:cleft lip and palate transmembrane protein 1-domain-containing protein [Aspergillus bertholletiae]
MPEQQRQRRDEPEPSSGFKGALQGLAFFLLTQFIFSQFFGGRQQNTTDSSGKPGGISTFADRPARSEITEYSAIPDIINPIWLSDSALDMNIYVSPSVVLPTVKSSPASQLVLNEKNFTLGNYSDTREIDTTIHIPKEVQNNGTLFAHFMLGLSGHQLDPSAKDYSTDSAVYFFRPLNQYLPKKKAKKLKNLLAGSEEAEEEVEDNTPDVSIASYYHPNFTVSLIPDSGAMKFRQIHPAVRSQVQLEASGARDISGKNGWYYPIVYLNTFWQLRSHMMELNSTVETVPLRITLSNLQNWKFSMMTSVDDSAKQTARQAAFGASTPGGGDGTEFEMVKEILLDTNIWLLGTTGVVTILHMIFETLAFKNDIAHWRKKKDVVGTSVRTILANVFMQAVVFLYLMDNSENTSWMILASQGFGILLEAWKITKTVDVRLRQPSPNSFFSFLPYVVVFEDKHKLTETEQKTKEYDEIAFRYLYIVAVPLLAAYAAYSLVYNTHKSWYSYIIETLVGSVYAYGFLMMVPSLYINYRLKSVAHMPGKALTYKFLNTFIDDLFAFTVKMPWLHRLATLRDDVIFFVWLYQSWKYRVDYTRVNEFGQGGDSDAEEEPPAVEAKDTKEKAETPASSKASGKETSKSSTRKRK